MTKNIQWIISRQRRKFELQCKVFREYRSVYREGGIKKLLQRQLSEEIRNIVELTNVIHEELLRETGCYKIRIWHVFLLTFVIQVLWSILFFHVYAYFLSLILNAESYILSATYDFLIFVLGIAPVTIVLLLTLHITGLFSVLFFLSALVFRMLIWNLIESNPL